MMKSSELVLIVDSVEEAVKFYTEKLAFDIVDAHAKKDGDRQLLSAHLRKGKCFITFRMPHVEELAEFSFIKRCVSRCVCLYVEMKKGIEKYFDRCQKKGVKVLAELKTLPSGDKEFSLRDPFGLKLTFAQPAEKKALAQEIDVCGMTLKRNDVIARGKKDEALLNDVIDHLRRFGILRRAGKKYAKQKIKQIASNK